MHSLVDKDVPDGSAVRHSKYFRLCKLQEVVYSGATFDPFKMHRDIESISEYLLLPADVSAKAIRCFEDTVAKTRNPFNNYGLLMAICLVVVCRNIGERAPIRLTEVIEAFARQNYRISLRVLAKNLSYAENIMPVQSKFRQPDEFVGRIIEKLREIPCVSVRISLSNAVPEKYFSDLAQNAKELIYQIPLHKRSGKNPFLLAASAVFASSVHIATKSKKENIFSKAQYSKDVGIAEFTLRNHLSSLFDIKPAPMCILTPAVA